MHGSNETAKSTVLLADTFTPMRTSVGSALLELGHKVVHAVDHLEAAHAIERRAPDSIIVSSALGARHGIPLVRQIAAAFGDATPPIVLVIEDRAAMKAVEDAPLPASVVPLVKFARPGDKIVSAVVHAHARAMEGAPARPMQRRVLLSTLADGVRSRLDLAFCAFDDVLRRVANNELGGPMMPALVGEVRSVLANRDIDFAALATLVRKHPALVVRLLAVANSAFYRGRGEKYGEVAIEAAIARLGLRTTADLLQAVAMLSFVMGHEAELRQIIVENLTRAYAVALLASEFARIDGSAPADAAYTIGLLHNVGATFLAYALAISEDAPWNAQIGRDALGTVMASRTPELNARMIERLNLPSTIHALHIATCFGSCIADPAERALIASVHRGMWAASHLLGMKDPKALEPDTTSELLRVSRPSLDTINEKIVELHELVHLYGSTTNDLPRDHGA